MNPEYFFDMQESYSQQKELKLEYREQSRKRRSRLMWCSFFWIFILILAGLVAIVVLLNPSGVRDWAWDFLTLVYSEAS